MSFVYSNWIMVSLMILCHVIFGPAIIASGPKGVHKKWYMYCIFPNNMIYSYVFMQMHLHKYFYATFLKRESREDDSVKWHYDSYLTGSPQCEPVEQRPQYSVLMFLSIL